MDKILRELQDNQNVRANLSDLRKLIKEENEKKQLLVVVQKQEPLFFSFLHSDDAKTRKNAALLLGDLAYQNATSELYDAYVQETTLFVRASYLEALAQLDVEDKLEALKDSLAHLLSSEVTPENRKHTDEEIRALREIIIQYEGITRHTADIKGKKVSVILMTNRSQRETVRRSITCGTATVHPLGVLVETEHLSELMKLRTYREMIFPLQKEGFFPADPVNCAQEIWNSNILGILNGLHKEQGSYYFRIECKSAFELEERSAFTKKLAAELERLSKGALINSTSDYEVELRMIANKDGEFFVGVALSTIKSNRFAYRKNAIAASIHPSTAALIMEIAAPYLKEDAQIMDPFCGVGTMLIERDERVPAREMYGTDIFGDAILFARENTDLAKKKINYIHRDFFDFKHDYLFDEIVTNMPLRGKKSKQEMDDFYRDFFEKSKEILAKEAILVMYTNEIGFVKKQLRLHKEYSLLQETCLQAKNDFYLLILSYKG